MRGQPIIIQQDWAKPHTAKVNKERLEALGKADGWNITFDTQPAQSPDLNKNDLAFFYSLQCAANKLKGKSKNTKDLMTAVTKAFHDYDKDQLLRLEALQMQIWREILKNEGGNDFAMPHSGIRKRARNGLPVVDYSVPADVVQAAKEALLRLQSL